MGTIFKIFLLRYTTLLHGTVNAVVFVLVVLAILAVDLGISDAVASGLYRCDKLDGSIEFRDRPCQSSEEEQSYLPIPNTRSMPSMYSDDNVSYSANVKSKRDIREASGTGQKNPTGAKKKAGQAKQKDLLKQKLKEKSQEERVAKRLAKKLVKERAIEQRRKERADLRDEKNRIKNALKLERRKIRCQKLDEKLKAIEDEFRTGCRIKRWQQLQKEKEHCLNMKRRYSSLKD